MVTRSTNLLTGIAQSRAWHSTESSSFDAVPISNAVHSRRAQSICVSAPCAGSAYEATDCSLLSADLAAGIRRVKGVTKLRALSWL
jgi:hypothetical protein